MAEYRVLEGAFKDTQVARTFETRAAALQYYDSLTPKRRKQSVIEVQSPTGIWQREYP